MPPPSSAALGEMHDSGADPVVILQDLLELTHWVTRLKVAPEAAAGSADSERAQGLAMAGKLSMAALTRAWTLLLKGLQETLAAPSPLRAAEMALIRLCYAADLPSPSDAIKALQNGGVPAAGVRDRRRAGAARGGPRNARRRSPLAAPAPQPADGGALAPELHRGRGAVRGRREARLVHHLMHHVHEVRCEPGLIEFRPQAKAPADLAPRLSALLEPMDRPALDCRGLFRRRQADAGGAEGGERRRAAQPRRSRTRCAGDSKTFPGAKLEAVRRKGEQTSLVAELVGSVDEPPGRGLSRRRRDPGKRVLNVRQDSRIWAA